MEPKDAINEAVDFAIKGNFLDGYFKEQRMNIVGNLLTEFNQEDYDRNRRAEGFEDGVEYGKELGRSEGERKTAIENAKNALAMGLSPEQASQITALPLEQVIALKKELDREPTTAK